MFNMSVMQLRRCSLRSLVRTLLDLLMNLTDSLIVLDLLRQEMNALFNNLPSLTQGTFVAHIV